MKADSIEHASHAVFNPREGSLETTGLGMIACLAIAIGSLVYDGTLALSSYLVFVAFLLVGAGGLFWRIAKPTLARKADDRNTRQ